MTDADLKSAIDHLAASETGHSVVRLGKVGTVLELLRERV